MIESIITDYLRQNRRLVIPELGAFLKKEGGETVFVPFLNKDDGVLAGLVRQTYGASATEAEGIIAKYVENVQNGIDGRGAFVVSPLGSLKKDANGILFLDSKDLNPRPATRKEVVTEPVAAPEVLEETMTAPAPEVVTEPELLVETMIAAAPVEEIMEEVSEEEDEEVAPEFTTYIRPTPPVRAENAAAEPVAPTVTETADAPKTLNDLIREKQEQPSRTLHEQMSEKTVAPAPKPVVKRHAVKPAPTTATSATTPRHPAQAPIRNEKRGDIILILAVVVAVIAVAAMIYAYAVVDLPLFNLN